MDSDRPEEEHVNHRYERVLSGLRGFKGRLAFVDIEDFMEHVLGVPDDWKTHFTTGARLVTPKSEKEPLYELFVVMLNTILDATCKSSPEPIGQNIPQSYVLNESGNVSGGTLDKTDRSNLTCAQPIQILELKPFHGALIDESCIPRLRKKGQDSSKERAGLPNKSPPLTVSQLMPTLENAVSIPPELPTATRKRPADESGLECREPKRRRESTSGDASGQTHEFTSWPQETNLQGQAHIQVGDHLWEQLSIPAFHPISSIGFIDGDRIQFYQANDTVNLVSSSINFGINDDTGGLDKLIAIVIAFSRLSLLDNGTLRNPLDGNLIKGSGSRPIHNLNPGVRAKEERKLEFGGDGKTGPFTLTYGEVIHCEPFSLVGRSTTVLSATSTKWKDVDLAVKICWPDTDRTSECEFLRKVIEKAECSTDQWALKHLPGLLFAQDIVFDSDSTHRKVASLFDNADFVNIVEHKQYKHEERMPRIIIQELLCPLLELTDVKDIAQVLLDVACAHRWLYEDVGILHQDLSLNNIMCRMVDGKVYGVLMDFDLSSWTADLTNDYTKTSQQRMGTPPYMARDLLAGTNPIHLYRHDVESFFYIMLILATHYTIEAPKGGKKGRVRMYGEFWELPYREWFGQLSYKTLGSIKSEFFREMDSMDISPPFEDFRNWLRSLHLSFFRGELSRMGHQLEKFGDPVAGKEILHFDKETLGGHVNYSALVDPARNLPGKLEGLIVRYESQLESPDAAAAMNAAQARP